MKPTLHDFLFTDDDDLHGFDFIMEDVKNLNKSDMNFTFSDDSSESKIPEWSINPNFGKILTYRLIFHVVFRVYYLYI